MSYADYRERAKTSALELDELQRAKERIRELQEAVDLAISILDEDIYSPSNVETALVVLEKVQ